MAKYRKKPIVIDAFQWENFNCEGEEWVYPDGDSDTQFFPFILGFEGLILLTDEDVRRFADCKYCGKPSQDHAFIDALDGPHLVCPGDWIIKEINGEFYPCKNDIFEKTYEKVERET